MSEPFHEPGASSPSPRRLVRRGVVLAMFVLGLGCGEDVLVGSLQLRSSSDAGADSVEAAEGDAGLNEQGANAQRARAKAECRAEHENHCDEKSH